MTDILISPLAPAAHREPARPQLGHHLARTRAQAGAAAHRAGQALLGAVGLTLIAGVGCAGVLGLWELAAALSDAIGVAMSHTIALLQSPTNVAF